MSDTHDAATCDQAKREIETLRRHADAMADALAYARKASGQIYGGTYFRKPHEMLESQQWQKLQWAHLICVEISKRCANAIAGYDAHKNGRD
jgi:hypothetical protein